MPAKAWRRPEPAGLRPEELARLSDPEIEHRLSAMTMQLPTAQLPTRAVSPGPHAMASVIASFARLAKGGLGEVYVALDQELHREVALKQINESHADNADSRARFILEAEITGGLEHPSIVPVYTLGYHRDGRPYYAMRFIRGRSLADAIDRITPKPMRHMHRRKATASKCRNCCGTSSTSATRWSMPTAAACCIAI